MKKLLLTLTVFILFPKEIVACDCVYKSLVEYQEREIKKSECIFIGKITEINDDSTYKITVVESLDGGDLQGNVYLGLNLRYCEPYVDKVGTWLVYGRMEDGFLKMNICGISRSFENPSAPPSGSTESLEFQKKLELEKEPNQEPFLIWGKLARLDLANEIYALRKRRDFNGKASK
ncbi:hypothetical protein [Maribacter sp. 2307UL18-2]|uniref:hypothetical protein n=1 Tax=Maribacter sp. 2307UL18-2 TaxID=3386274 RepID=UPI0039BD0280